MVKRGLIGLIEGSHNIVNKSTKRQHLKLSDDQTTLLILDFFKGQSTERSKNVMQDNYCAFGFVPKHLTAHFKPLDLNVNGQAKQFSKQKSEQWNAEKVTNEIKQGCVLSEHRDEAVHHQSFACTLVDQL